MKVIYRNTHESIPLCISFSPRDNLLAWTSFDGSLTRVQDVISADLPGPNVKTASRKPLPPARLRGTLDTMADAVDFDNDDWVIDDLPDASFKDDSKMKYGDRYMKEMGE